MTLSKLFEKCADLLEKPGAWTKHELARDAHRRTVHPRSPNAVCWCAAGAIHRFADGDLIHAAIYALQVMVGSVTGWNDFGGRTQAEVVAIFRAASSAAKANGQ